MGNENPIEVPEALPVKNNNKDTNVTNNNSIISINKIFEKGITIMKKINIIIMAVCQIYSSIIVINNNVEIIVDTIQSVLVRPEGLLIHL